MKKFILLFCLSFFILSCEKEEENCNCGIITDDEILPNNCYSLSVRNECSNNIETFSCFDYDVWIDNYVGNSICFNDIDSW